MSKKMKKLLVGGKDDSPAKFWKDVRKFDKIINRKIKKMHGGNYGINHHGY